MQTRLISVVMATKNSGRFLSEALASIPAALESAGDYEVLVADGDSTDDTLEISAANPKVRIVSESDNGIYDGMNNAIGAAEGDWLLILNSDDLLTPGGLAAAIRRAESNAGCEVVSGGVASGFSVVDAVTLCQNQPLTSAGAIFGIPAINARLFRTALLRRLGPIRTNVGLAADREFLLRLLSSSTLRLGLQVPLYFYRRHSGSQTLAGGWAARRRIYLSEMKLASVLVSESSRAPCQRLYRAAYAVAALKAGISGVGFALEGGGIVCSPVDLVRGLWWSGRWRGKLSGC